MGMSILDKAYRFLLVEFFVSILEFAKARKIIELFFCVEVVEGIQHSEFLMVFLVN